MEPIKTTPYPMFGIEGYYHKIPTYESINENNIESLEQSVINGLKKIYEINEGSGYYFCVLWGVKVDDEIIINDNLKIIPFEKLPESKQKDWLKNHTPDLTSPYGYNITDYIPDSILIYKTKFKPLVYLTQEDFNVNRSHQENIGYFLYTISLVLTLIGPRSTILGAHWLEFDDKDIQEVSEKYYMKTFLRIFNRVVYQPRFYPSYPILEISETINTINNYLNFNIGNKGRLNIALYRFNLAMIKEKIGEKTVELSIAMECILGGEGNTEISYKLITRFVRFLGGDKEERLNNKKILKKLYDFRSTLMHTGNEPKNLEINKHIIDSGLIIFSMFLRKIIELGDIPHWKEFDILN